MNIPDELKIADGDTATIIVRADVPVPKVVLSPKDPGRPRQIGIEDRDKDKAIRLFAEAGAYLEGLGLHPVALEAGNAYCVIVTGAQLKTIDKSGLFTNCHLNHIYALTDLE